MRYPRCPLLSASVWSITSVSVSCEFSSALAPKMMEIDKIAASDVMVLDSIASLKRVEPGV